MINKILKLKNSLFEYKSAASIGIFRIFFGSALFFQTLWFIQSDFIRINFTESKVRFPFSYIEFIEPLSESGMQFILLLMLVSSIGIISARFYKLSVLIHFLSFTYLWCLDKSYFNNHYYFISLMLFLMFFTSANYWGKMGGSKSESQLIPNWQIFILKFQVFLVFFIAGIHKCNYYWVIEFQPMKHILETKAEISGLDWLSNEFIIVFFSWFGLIFDLCIGFLLWFKRSRNFGVLFYVFFNLTNFWLFYDIGEIGFFPFILLACIPLFYTPDLINSKFKVLKGKSNSDKNIYNEKKSWKTITFLIVIYFFFQITIPFRYLLNDDNVDWSGVGQRFSWRMKIMYKEIDMHFYIQADEVKNKIEVNVGNFLNEKQYTNLMYYPDFIPVVAHFIKNEAERRGMNNVKVYSDFNVGFMGHEKQPLVDPNYDLSSLYSNSDKNWIIPLR